MTNEKKSFTVLVEGNIGVGKSTFLEYFKQFESVELMPEPVEAWQNLNGANMLELVYADTKKWAFSFQSYALLLMLENHLKPTEKKIKIMERSLYSAHHCFIELLTHYKHIEKEERAVLHKWHEFVTTQFDVLPDLIIYLRAAPSIVFERMKKRARSEERNVTTDYIEQLHIRHEDWLMRPCGNDIPVVVLDASLEADEMKREYEKCARIMKLL